MNETPTWKTLEMPGKVILGGEMNKRQMSLEETQTRHLSFQGRPSLTYLQESLIVQGP
jgi:hypothetical protein